MITSIVELEVLSPLYIKGKDLDYGEGFIAVDEQVYLIDNNNLCRFISKKTYDEYGELIDIDRDYVFWYSHFMLGPENTDDLVNHYNSFASFVQARSVDNKDDVPPEYKDKFIEYFLLKTKLLPDNKRERKEILIRENIAIGVTKLSKKIKKTFVQNGMGLRFIPGTSIKGAIRNALLWKIMSDATKQNWLDSFVFSNLNEYRTLLSDKDKNNFLKSFSSKPFHDQTIQSKSFCERIPEWNDRCQVSKNTYDKLWSNSNEILRDFLRIVKISDANFTEEPYFKERVVGAFCRNGKDLEATFILKKTIDRRNKEFPVITSLETVIKGSKARFKITIDNELVEQFFPVNPPPYMTSATGLLAVVNEFFMEVVSREKDYYSPIISSYFPDQVNNFYESLFPSSLNNTFRIRIGWGGGMMSKTQFLNLMTKKRADVRNLIKNREQQVAPKSRCLLTDENHKPIQPLGWCSLKILSVGDEYPGIDAYKGKMANIRTIEQPRGSVKAVITSDKPPITVRILEGTYQGKYSTMPRMQLQNLGLATGSEVYLNITVAKQQIISVQYMGKV